MCVHIYTDAVLVYETFLAPPHVPKRTLQSFHLLDFYCYDHITILWMEDILHQLVTICNYE
jgi:hypothetical protein